MIRRIIFIGQSGGNTIYFDKKSGNILKAPKSFLLDMEKSKHNTRKIIIILTTFPILLSLAGGVANFFFGKIYYTATLFIFLMFLWSMETIMLTYTLEKSLYFPIKHKRIDEIEIGTKSEFRQAIYSNNIWNIFGDKKVSLWKKIGIALFIIIICCLTILLPLIMYLINLQEEFLGKAVGSEFIAISALGVMPFVSVYVLWINNPLEWLKVVEKYQNKKMKVRIK